MKQPHPKTERPHRAALTLVAAFFVLFIILLALLIGGIVVSILAYSGVLSPYDTSPEPWLIVLIMSLICLVSGFCLATAFSRLSLKPINDIVNRMNRLASGDFHVRLPLGPIMGSHPTFVEFADSFNKMAEELENTELLRSDFINNFSHEFKTPIVSIAGFAKVLKRGNLTDAEKLEYIEIIESESLRLSNMATNVLTLTRFENQSILQDVRRFNLSEQLRNSIVSLEGKWVRKNLQFNLDFTEIHISGDQSMLKHIWINLLDNAIKFSPENGTVTVRIRKRDFEAEVAIENHGPMIPAGQINRIFSKFYQADESHASEGNGIGLALVKRITDLHHGRILVDSSEGLTVFRIFLPLEYNN